MKLVFALTPVIASLTAAFYVLHDIATGAMGVLNVLLAALAH